jgi:hypothetical protein
MRIAQQRGFERGIALVLCENGFDRLGSFFAHDPLPQTVIERPQVRELHVSSHDLPPLPQVESWHVPEQSRLSPSSATIPAAFIAA